MYKVDFIFIFFKQLFKPVLADANHAAVVLVASSLVQHAGVDDVSDGDVQVVSTQMLQQLQGLVSGGLEDQNNEKIKTVRRRRNKCFLWDTSPQRLTVSSNFVKDDMSMTHTASLQHFTSAPTMSNQSGL